MSVNTCIFDRQSICATCLSRDRKLFTISNLAEFARFYSKLSLTQSDKVCWECCHAMQRTVTFINRAQKAQAWLQDMINNKNCDIPCLSTLGISEPSCLSSTDVEIFSSDASAPDPLFVPVKEDIEDQNAISSEFQDEIEVKVFVDEEMKVEILPTNDDTTVMSTILTNNVEQPINSKNNMGPHIDTMHMHNDAPPINTTHDNRQPDNMMHIHNMRPQMNTMHMYNEGPPINTMNNIGLPINMPPAPIWRPDNAIHMHNIGPHINIHNVGPHINTMHNTGLSNNMNIMNNTEPHINTMHTGLSRTTVHNMGIPIDAMQSGEPPTTELQKIRLPYTKSKTNKLTTKDSKPTEISVSPDSEPPDYVYTEESLTEEGMLKWRETKRNMDCVTERPAEFRCDKCIEPLKSRNHIEAHAIMHTEVYGEYECDICTQHLAKEECLEAHRKLHYRVLKCRYCDFVWDDANGMREHCSALHDIRQTVWHCEPCKREFPSRRTLTKHQRRHRRARCEQCGALVLQTWLKTHMTVAHHGGKPLHTCEECGKEYRGLDGLRAHMKIHSTEMNPDAYCAECHIRFRDMSGLRLHIRTSVKHDGQSFRKSFIPTKEDHSHHWQTVHAQLECDICRQTRRNTHDMERHMRASHLPIKCPQCPRVYSKWKYYRQHQKMAHPVLAQEPPESRYCVECDMQFPSIMAYKMHVMNAHRSTPKKRWPCPACNKTLNNKDTMKKHYALFHSDKTSYQCPHCGKYLSSKCSLQHHLNSHLNIKLPKDKLCSVCGRGFSTYKTMGARRAHKKMKHEGKVLPKNKICDYCGRTFTTKRILATHINMHTGARPYVCKLCGADFGHQSALYLHGRLKHKIRDKNGKLLQRKKSKSKATTKKMDKDISENVVEKFKSKRKRH